MKHLILVLMFVLSCSMSFASTGPEKDGPFPKKMAGQWASQNSSVTVYIRIGSMNRGRSQLFVVLKDRYGKTVGVGSTMIDEYDTSAEVTMSFNGHSEIMVIRLMAVDGQSGNEPLLQVSLSGKTVFFYKLTP